MLHEQQTASSASLVFKMSSANPQSNLILCFIAWTKWVNRLCQSEEVSSPWGLKTFKLIFLFFFLVKPLKKTTQKNWHIKELFSQWQEFYLPVLKKSKHSSQAFQLLFSFYFFFCCCRYFYTRVVLVSPPLLLLSCSHCAGILTLSQWHCCHTVGSN